MLAVGRHTWDVFLLVIDQEFAERIFDELLPFFSVVFTIIQEMDIV